MGKSRITGIDDFLRSTEISDQVKVPTKNVVNPEQLTLVNFQLPVSLKKRLSRYCLDNDVSIKDLLNELIKERIK